MYETRLPVYLTYSSLVHVVFLSILFILNFSKKATKDYYVVDFLGGGIVAGRSVQEAAEKESEKIKTKIVNPEEDLLLKSKKKPSKNEKEIITTTPPIPTVPIPKVSSKIDGLNTSIIPDAGSGVGVGFGGSGGGSGNFPYTWYVQSMKKKLDTNWNVASGFSTRIYTQVAFTIKKDGSISNIDVEESSKNEIFDRAALRAVEYANPMAPLPPDFPEPELRVHVRFVVKR